MSVYALNAQLPAVDRELCIPFAWPFDAWECFIPSGAVPKINILEKLILSLIGSGAVATETELLSFLQNDIDLDEELIENAFELCRENGYINKVKSNLELNKKARDLLSTCEDGVIIDPDYADSRKRVFLFRDLVTDAVVPFFEVEDLSRDRVKFDETCGILLREKQKSGVRPNTAQRRIAMRTWGRMFAERVRAEEAQSRSLDLDGKPAPETAPADGLDQDGMEEADPAPKKDTPAYDLMQLYSDKPDTLHLIGYFVINRYCTSEITVISPFGVSCDNWFRNLVNRLRIADENFEERLRLMVAGKVEILKDKIAFNNDPEVALFEKIPVICNDPQYEELKSRIVIMNDYLTDAGARNSHVSVFTDKMRQSIEITARRALKKHPELEQTRSEMKALVAAANNSYTGLKQRIKTAAIDFRFGDGVLTNMLKAQPGDCSGVKDALALLVLDSVEHPEHSDVCSFVSACHDWIRDLPRITDGLGNASSHGNKISMKKTPEEYYKYTEGIIDNLFTYLIN